MTVATEIAEPRIHLDYRKSGEIPFRDHVAEVLDRHALGDCAGRGRSQGPDILGHAPHFIDNDGGEVGWQSSADLIQAVYRRDVETSDAIAQEAAHMPTPKIAVVEMPVGVEDV